MKKSHVRNFHAEAPQKNFSREIFLRGVGPSSDLRLGLSGDGG